MKCKIHGLQGLALWCDEVEDPHVDRDQEIVEASSGTQEHSESEVEGVCAQLP